MSLFTFLKSLASPRNSAAFTLLNFLLGTGPLIVPQPFFQAGFLFSTIWTILVWFINFTTAKYIGESILLINKHMDQRLIEEKGGETQKQQQIQLDKSKSERIRTFDHVEQITYLYGSKWRFVPCLSVALYLLGSGVSKCIMTGETLSRLFDGVFILENFQLWLALFFISGAAFAFKSIEKTKIMQVTMIVVRFISIGLMIIGAFILIGQNKGIKSLAPEGGNPYFNSQYFGDIFSNLIYTFMCNHSLPGMTNQLTQLSQISSFINLGYIVSIITMIIVPITAAFAFGNDLIGRLVVGEGHQLVYYNQDFKGRLDFIYYVVSFYVFLNIATFSVYIIVIRRNLLAMFTPNVNSDRLSKTTAVITITILSVILIIAFALRDYIQTALNFTGGILGCLIMFFLPALEVLGARRLFPNRRSLKHPQMWIPIFIMILGLLSMGFNLYQTISNLLD